MGKDHNKTSNLHDKTGRVLAAFGRHEEALDHYCDAAHAIWTRSSNNNNNKETQRRAVNVVLEILQSTNAALGPDHKECADA